ncbi:hypothetical protein ADEAN_000376000 [Angomonas deanei]|uniref:Uncharacterized protein n=1 Tax=Angomonas deanei TaxID=59799 RepID=A0A7G2C9R2_9TRYP|nr:hypothetical protein ADEAN_000376000 [Angomonas deanei]
MESRRVFLRVYLESGELLRLLQLDYNVCFQNVLSLLGGGTLYWADRPLLPRESPSEVGMPTGVDNSVKLCFVPQTTVLLSSYTTEGHTKQYTSPPKSQRYSDDSFPTELAAYFAAGSRDPSQLISPSFPPRLREEPSPPPSAAWRPSIHQAWGDQHLYGPVGFVRDDRISSGRVVQVTRNKSHRPIYMNPECLVERRDEGKERSTQTRITREESPPKPGLFEALYPYKSVNDLSLEIHKAQMERLRKNRERL